MKDPAIVRNTAAAGNPSGKNMSQRYMNQQPSRTVEKARDADRLPVWIRRPVGGDVRAPPREGGLPPGGRPENGDHTMRAR